MTASAAFLLFAFSELSREVRPLSLGGLTPCGSRVVGTPPPAAVSNTLQTGYFLSSLSDGPEMRGADRGND